MNKSKLLTIAVLVLPSTIATPSTSSFAQKKVRVPVCKAAALAVFKPLPKLKYQCDAELSDNDEKTLNETNRIRAIKALGLRLESFASPAWWASESGRPEALRVAP